MSSDNANDILRIRNKPNNIFYHNYKDKIFHFQKLRHSCLIQWFSTVCNSEWTNKAISWDYV